MIALCTTTKCHMYDVSLQETVIEGSKRFQDCCIQRHCTQDPTTRRGDLVRSTIGHTYPETASVVPNQALEEEADLQKQIKTPMQRSGVVLGGKANSLGRSAISNDAFVFLEHRLGTS